MASGVEVLPSAAKEMAALPREIQKRVARRIDALAESPHPQGARKLAGAERLFRVRVGDDRIIYSIDGVRRVVLIVKIGHRARIYRGR